MKHEKLSQALNEISDPHIAEAAGTKGKPRLAWLGAVAAVLAMVLLLRGTGLPLALQAKAVAVADYPRYEWQYRGDEMDAIHMQLADFFAQSMTQTLSGAGSENQTYSPVNLYLALSGAAELTGGDTRQQILDTIGVDSIDTLRAQANTLWNACYYDDKDQTLLANSIWLDEDLSYTQSVMDTLAENYYTSVYQGDFGSSRTNKAITNWLDDQTGGLLKNSTQAIGLDPETVLAMYSTVFYRAMWTEYSEFSPAKNTDGPFHAPDGDVPATFMNKKEYETTYYWGEDFGAISLGLRDGSQMWLILPDEDKTAEDVLAAGEYAYLVMGAYGPNLSEQNHKYMKVNLSLPKFDIRASGNLQADLEAMGITDIFRPDQSDFSASVRTDPGSFPPFVYLAGVNQATRVAIDEKGVTAASYIELPGAGAAPPPEEIIDFILDRPFLFVISNRYGIPLFAGVVNQP